MINISIKSQLHRAYGFRGVFFNHFLFPFYFFLLWFPWQPYTNEQWVESVKVYMMNISIKSQLCRHMVSEEYFLSRFFFLFFV